MTDPSPEYGVVINPRLKLVGEGNQVGQATQKDQTKIYFVESFVGGLHYRVSRYSEVRLEEAMYLKPDSRFIDREHTKMGWNFE